MKNANIKISGVEVNCLGMDFWDFPLDHVCPACRSYEWNSSERSCYSCGFGAGTVYLVNCTPHSVNYITDEASIIIDASGIIPRCQTVETKSNLFLPFPIINKEFGEVENLPEPQNNVYFIVSSLVAQASKREDLLVPNTVRSENGQIIGCDSFAQIL